MQKARMVFLVVVGLLASSSAWAQTGAVIGTATDATGGVLPGVTVEAESPALIEGVRATVTNEQGFFRIIELPPGVYAVIFTLQGFRSARTEDVVLTTGFTAAVNAALEIGGVAETITVSSLAVQVDIVNTTVQQVISSEVLQSLPMGQQLGALRNLLSGAVAPRANVRDVGGNTGEGQHGFSVNGSRQADFQRMQDGMVTNTLLGAGNWTSTQNPSATEEVVVTTGGFSAGAQTGGGVINTVSRSGGNIFSGTFNGDFATEGMRSDNLSDALRARGATTPAAIRQRYDVGGGFGGPIVRDKLWFFSGARYWTTASNTSGNFFNKTPASLFYVPDLDNPAYGLNYYSVVETKVTWQATAKQKFMGSYAWERSCNCFYNIDRGLTSPEASGSHFYSPNRRIQATWTYPVSNNLLLWAGVTDQFFRHNKIPEGGGTENQRSILELSRNYRYGAPGHNLGLTGSFGFQDNQQRNQNFTLSYLTGGHYLKVGATTMQGILHAERTIFEDMGFRFQNGVPQAVDLWATPYQWSVNANYLSIFAEDQWTTDRLTLNLGVRYDGLRGSVPDQNLPAGNFVPGRSFKAISNRPSYNDLSPRLGVAYDLFGTGQTALKGSLSRSPVFKSPGNVNTIINPVDSAERGGRDVVQTADLVAAAAGKPRI